MEELEVEIHEDAAFGIVTLGHRGIGQTPVVEVKSRIWVQDAEVFRVVVGWENGFERCDGLVCRDRCSGSILSFRESECLLGECKQAKR